MLEERESGVVQAQQVWSPVYVDALILRDRNADDNNTNGPNGDGLEQRHYVAQDANFNVTALINATTGAAVERYYYQAYGVPTVLDANFVPRVNGQSQFAWRYLHQGGRFDWAAGYYHFRNRDLSPTLGRWLNQDPIGFQGSKWNLYEYVEGRPTVGLDPNGLTGFLYNDCFSKCKEAFISVNGPPLTAGNLAGCQLFCTAVGKCKIKKDNCETVMTKACGAGRTCAQVAIALCIALYPK